MSRSHSHDQQHQHDHSHAAHEHGHTHGHGHGHHHEVPRNFNAAFALAVILNTGFVLVEFIFGWIAHSTALMADAGHNLSDVLGLLLAWGAALVAKKQPSRRYTYGLRSTSIWAALANAGLLVLACGAIAWEAIQRFGAPPEVAGRTVMIVAAVGILINGFSAWLFMAGQHDLNIRGAFLHMAGDAVISLGVALAGLLMLYTGWYWADPVISLVIVLIVLLGTRGLLRDAMTLSLSAVPSQIDLQAVQQFLAELPGVTAVQDLHIWGMSTTETALTAHLVMPDGYAGDRFMDSLTHELKDRFAIHHSTLQIRQDLSGGCVLDH